MAIFGKKPRKPVTPEERLQTPAQCGIRLNEGRTINDLLVSHSREEYEEEPYLWLLIAMGGDVEGGAEDGRFSDNIWRVDPECIAGNGDYARIAERMSALVGVDLRIENIGDRFDFESEPKLATLEFECDGTPQRLEFEFEHDWMDIRALDWFIDELDRRGGPRRITYLDLGRQDFLLGCATDAQRQRLNEKTGLPFQFGIPCS